MQLYTYAQLIQASTSTAMNKHSFHAPTKSGFVMFVQMKHINQREKKRKETQKNEGEKNKHTNWAELPKQTFAHLD